MKTREHQLEEFLFSFYDLCEGKPDSVAFDVVGDWMSERDQEFDRENIIPFSQELSEAGFVRIEVMGAVDLLPAGIHIVEKFRALDQAKKEKTPNFGSDIPTSDEVRIFLRAACEEVGFDLAKEFNGTSIGERLNFSTEKIRLCMQRAKTDGFIHEPNISTQSNPLSQITTRTQSLILGQIDEREGAITLNADNSTNTDNSTNLTVGGNMTGSNVIQNSAGATQALTFTAGQKLDFQNFVDLARTNIDDLGLSEANRTQLSNSLDIIEGSLAGDSVPDTDVLKKELTTTQRLIESATGSAVGGVIAEHLSTLFSYLPI